MAIHPIGEATVRDPHTWAAALLSPLDALRMIRRAHIVGSAMETEKGVEIEVLKEIGIEKEIGGIEKGREEGGEIEGGIKITTRTRAKALKRKLQINSTQYSIGD